MEKRSSVLFSEPRKQSSVALILIIYNRFRSFVSRLWPFILIALVTGNVSTSGPDRFTIMFIFVALSTAITGILAYYRYFFWIEGDELIIKKGIFNKSITQIPFDRIQTIDFEQNLIHQFFKVVGLKIETAGSQNTEIKMQALETDLAYALRDYILENKEESIEVSWKTDGEVVPDHEELIYEIDFVRMLKIGITENHLRSGFIILFGMYWFIENIREAGLNLDEYGESLMGTVVGSIALIVFLTVAFLLISIGFSMIKVILTYFDLKFKRRKGGFKLVSGLFNKKEVAAVDKKIQLVEWSQNLLQKALGFHHLVLKQASSVELNTKKAIQVPGVEVDDINNIKDYLFPYRNEENLSYESLHPYFLYRRLIYIIPLFSLLSGGLIYLKTYPAGVFFGLFGLYLIYTSFKKYRKAKYVSNNEAVFMQGGVFGSSQWLIMHHKIQSLEIRQSPFMRRRNISNLIIHTASGSRMIPYIESERARYLYDYLSYRVETDDKEWM